jgi:hypothetical protein
MGVPSNNPGTNDYVLVENLDVNCPNHYKYPGRAGKGCFGELMVMAASSKVILRCSSSNTQCTGLVKAADYPGGCICPYDIVKGQLIMRKQRQDGSFKWVHLECIGKGSNEMDTIASVCYVCNEVISTGQITKRVNQGGSMGVKHVTCGKSATRSEYVVEGTEANDMKGSMSDYAKGYFGNRSSSSGSNNSFVSSCGSSNSFSSRCDTIDVDSDDSGATIESGRNTVESGPCTGKESSAKKRKIQATMDSYATGQSMQVCRCGGLGCIICDVKEKHDKPWTDKILWSTLKMKAFNKMCSCGCENKISANPMHYCLSCKNFVFSSFCLASSDSEGAGSKGICVVCSRGDNWTKGIDNDGGSAL